MVGVEFKPFQFEGGLVTGGSLMVASTEDWVKIVRLYAHKLKTPDLPLEAVLVGKNSKGVPIFTLHQNQGLRLKTWAEAYGMTLVISL